MPILWLLLPRDQTFMPFTASFSSCVLCGVGLLPYLHRDNVLELHSPLDHMSTLLGLWLIVAHT